MIVSVKFPGTKVKIGDLRKALEILGSDEEWIDVFPHMDVDERTDKETEVTVFSQPRNVSDDVLHRPPTQVVYERNDTEH